MMIVCADCKLYVECYNERHWKSLCKECARKRINCRRKVVGPTMKICSKCKLYAECIYGSLQCKECRKKVSSSAEVKEKRKVYDKKYNNSGKGREARKKTEANSAARDRRKRYEASSKGKAKLNRYRKTRHTKDPTFRLRRIIGPSIRTALYGSKNGRTWDYLPYTPIELKAHLESLFATWMTWGNHGVYNAATWDDNDSSTWTWQIDHIIPQSKFLYSSLDCDAFRQCWALSNLRPLSAKQNISEGARR